MLSFAKNISKNLSNKLSKNYSQKRLCPAKKFVTDAINATPKRVIQKKKLKQPLIWLAIKSLIESQRVLSQKDSEISSPTEEKSKEILKKYTYVQKKKKKKKQIIDELILIWNMEYQKYKI